MSVVIPSLVLIGMVGVVVAGVLAALFGWERYHRPASGAAAPTAEVFVDPSTGRRMRVWVDAAGRRDYRED